MIQFALFQLLPITKCFIQAKSNKVIIDVPSRVFEILNSFALIYLKSSFRKYFIPACISILGYSWGFLVILFSPYGVLGGHFEYVLGNDNEYLYSQWLPETLRDYSAADVDFSSCKYSYDSSK